MNVNDLLDALEQHDGDMPVFVLNERCQGVAIGSIEWADTTPGPSLLIVPEPSNPVVEKQECHRCKASERALTGTPHLQTYTVEDKRQGISVMINVTGAYLFARANLAPLHIPAHLHDKLLITNLSETFCGAHVEHVDRSKPAIIGMLDRRMMLMDGTHRLCAWLKHEEKPIAFVLSEEQTRMFIMHSEGLSR